MPVQFIFLMLLEVCVGNSSQWFHVEEKAQSSFKLLYEELCGQYISRQPSTHVTEVAMSGDCMLDCRRGYMSKNSGMSWCICKY